MKFSIILVLVLNTTHLFSQTRRTRPPSKKLRSITLKAGMKAIPSGWQNPCILNWQSELSLLMTSSTIRPQRFWSTGQRRAAVKKTPKEQQQKDIIILDVFEGSAVVKLVASDWIDYLQMAKLKGEWLIINVLWEIKPESYQKFGMKKKATH